MPQLKTYDVFISHAWSYHEDYYRMVRFLDEAQYFYWRNYSVPHGLDTIRWMLVPTGG